MLSRLIFLYRYGKYNPLPPPPKKTPFLIRPRAFFLEHFELMGQMECVQKVNICVGIMLVGAFFLYVFVFGCVLSVSGVSQPPSCCLEVGNDQKYG